jgi:hypothetical protein
MMATGKASDYLSVQGEKTLQKSHVSLDLAKKEAQSTLAPLLQRMKRSRLIKNTDKVVRRLSQLTLNHPYKMRLAFERGDYEEVVLLYQQLQGNHQGTVYPSLLYLSLIPLSYTSLLYLSLIPLSYTSLLYLSLIPLSYTSLLYLLYLLYLSSPLQSPPTTRKASSTRNH